MRAINIWVTNQCNLCCDYCYEGKEKRIVELKKSDVDFLLNYIKHKAEETERIAINFHGGEPLMNVDVIERICEGLSGLEDKCLLSMTTNGTLINEQNIEIIKKYYISLSISLDGTEKAHNTCRLYKNKNGSYKDCIRGINIVRNNGIDFRCRMTITSRNYMYLYESVRFLAGIDIKNIVAVPDLFDRNWTDNMIEEIEQSIREIYKSNLDVEFVFFENCISKKGICRGGIDEINIDSDLNVYPCSCVVGYKEFCMGNIKTENYDKRIHNLIEQMNHEKIAECNGCMFYENCMTSRCRLFNRVLKGKGNIPSEVVCEFENMIFRLRYILNHTNGGI